MKKIITLFLFIICIQTTKAQFVTIPDATFVTWLQANVGSAMSGNQMDTTSFAVMTRTVVNIGYGNITNVTGIEYFKSLIDFNCTDNLISFLPPLPNTIKYLNVNRNQISNIIALPDSLIDFSCGGNFLSSLPSFPPTLKRLFCFTNQLTVLPSLPNSFTWLFCPDNQLQSLPILPNSMISLNCILNQLTSIPNLPTSLNALQCSYNQLTNLPSLPVSLYRLECDHNQLTNLPLLPTGLGVLHCFNNNISCFPLFPIIYNAQNPAPMINFDISNNPFTCLPNYIPAMDVNTLNFPLCISGNTLTNSNGCNTGNGITGKVFYDANSDCAENIGEWSTPNIPLKLYDNSNSFISQTNTHNNGMYYFNDTIGTYNVVIDTINKPYIVQCINPGIDSLINLTTTYTLEDSINFAITCMPGFDVGVQSIFRTGTSFPGITHTLTVIGGDMTHWYNLSCSSGISGTVSFSVSGPVTYVGPAGGALTPNVVGNIYTYTITDFGLVNNSTDFKLVFLTNTNALSGNVICVNATVTPIAGDNVPSNNVYPFCYNVANSYDPNIKEVYPIEVQTGFNDWLTYTIHFQNTGNAPAMNIRLEDNLDTKLDPETFELINYSHYNVIDVTTNHLTVRFPNIQLADSTSDLQGSIGFVQYRIKPKAGWINDTIRNSAEIYFDYNAPIFTNTAKSYFMTTTGIKDMSYLNEVVELSPNPTNGIISVSSQTNFNKIEVLSITGQTLLSETVNTKTHQLQLQNFAEGIYFVRVSYADGLSTVKKVVVSR